jgi:hypothetical protein
MYENFCFYINYRLIYLFLTYVISTPFTSTGKNENNVLFESIIHFDVNNMKTSTRRNGSIRSLLFRYLQRASKFTLEEILLHLLLIIMALQLFMHSFGLLNQFLPSSSILDKDLSVWHF